MPKRNPPPDVLAEEHVRRRIALEREKRGWSYEALASRMTKAGVPLNQSAIFKIERGDPPRRITVDELVGYARVFDLSVEELLADPDVVLEADMVELLDKWRQHLMAFEMARDRVQEVRDEIFSLAARSGVAREVVRRYLRERLPADEPDLPSALRALDGFEEDESDERENA